MSEQQLEGWATKCLSRVRAPRRRSMLVGVKSGWEVGTEAFGNTFTMSNAALC